MRRFHFSLGAAKVAEWVSGRAGFFGPKLQWFLSKGYTPHLFQLAFHTLSFEDGHLRRFRMLVAGRRGGKTLSVAWEVLFYVLHPLEFHWDANRSVSEEPLHVWVLVPNYRSSGRAAMRTIQKVLTDCEMVAGTDYRWNRGENWIEFANGGFLEFKTAEQADQLVGAGIDILWIDEAATIPNQKAYDFASPALDDKLGIVMCSSTPRGKNWWFDLFWGPDGQDDDEVGTVEYRSIDNPYFPKKAWEYRRRTYHPLLFKQEYEAAFDSMAGKALHGDWLHYFEWEELPLRSEEAGTHRNTVLNISNLDLDFYIGVDTSTGAAADRFAAVVIGVAKDRSRAFIMEVFAAKIPFPDQIDEIQRLFLKWRPYFIGIEANGYQVVLAQQAMRLPGLPPIVPVMSKGKKEERILSMAPIFKIGRVSIREDQRDFIDEWLDYDPELRFPKDDVLDAAEIALGTAGVLLPGMPDAPDEWGRPAGDVEELAKRDRAQSMQSRDQQFGFDENVGEW